MRKYESPSNQAPVPPQSLVFKMGDVDNSAAWDNATHKNRDIPSFGRAIATLRRAVDIEYPTAPDASLTVHPHGVTLEDPSKLTEQIPQLGKDRAKALITFLQRQQRRTTKIT